MNTTPAGSVVNDVVWRLRDVEERIAAAAKSAGRSPGSITLVAVSKTQPDHLVRAARDAGCVDFGESRPQELAARLDNEQPFAARWHFVGPLQRNKVKLVVGRATLIHSVDRIEVAAAIAEEAAKRGVVQRSLVQVNISDDPNKGGFKADEVLEAVARIRRLPHIAVEGLMTIPARDADPDTAFSALAEVRNNVVAKFPEVLHLSMGMSGDFEAAVRAGSTLVRVGSAIFGERDE